jgi:microsomal dipeptidase-like Zn-dependent dipeptidase
MTEDEWVAVVDKAIEMVGDDHVALGTDFDGGPNPSWAAHASPRFLLRD